MPLVNVMVNSRAYTIACDDGEEEHCSELADMVDSKVRELLDTVGQVGDPRLLLMAALLITDDYHAAGIAKHAKDFNELTITQQPKRKPSSARGKRAVASLETGRETVRRYCRAAR